MCKYFYYLKYLGFAKNFKKLVTINYSDYIKYIYRLFKKDMFCKIILKSTVFFCILNEVFFLCVACVYYYCLKIQYIQCVLLLLTQNGYFGRF